MITGVTERSKKIEAAIKTMEPGSSFSVDCTDVWRDGGVRTAYILHEDAGNNCSPAAYIDDGDWYHKDDEAVAKYLLGLYKTHSRQVDVSKVVSAEYVKDRILPRLTSGRNIDDLREHGIVNEAFMNLAVSYYLPFDFESQGDATIQVTQQMIEHAGLEVDSLKNYAMHNLQTEVELLSMSEMLRSLTGVGIDEMPGGGDDVVPMWILTTKNRMYGAAVLLYGADLFRKLQERFDKEHGGQKICLIGSSVHELIMVLYDRPEQLQDFLRMNQEVNATQVSEADYLADCVYYFDGHQVCALE